MIAIVASKRAATFSRDPDFYLNANNSQLGYWVERYLNVVTRTTLIVGRIAPGAIN